MLWIRILIIIFMLGSSVLILRQLTKKIADFDNILEVHSSGLVSEAEIRNRIGTLKLKNKSMLEINAQLISSKLKELPLIKEARVRVLLLPKKVYKIYITEASPWAVYKGQILDDRTNVLVKSREQGYSYHSKAINKLYSDFYNNRNSILIKIESLPELDHKTLVLIKELNDLIVNNLSFINLDQSKKLPSIKTDLIKIDEDNNLTIRAANLKIIAGIINNQIKNRIKRLDSIISKVIELGAAKEIEYIDLSLKTNEVILGKRSREILVLAKHESSQGTPLEQGQTYIPTQSQSPNGLEASPQGATL